MRIKVIDGFRTIAVLGVLWAHVWQLNGNPGFLIWKVNLAQLLSFFGTGVDLFFVISGFCMYLMYSSKKMKLSATGYLKYIGRRWLRIAPVFYAAVIIYGFHAAGFDISRFNFSYSLKQVMFIRNFFSEPSVFGPHLWSLSTEWQFYMLLPLVIFAIERFSFKKSMIALFTGCFIFRTIAWSVNVDVGNIIEYSILNRLVEFGVGMLTAFFYLNPLNNRLLKSTFGLIFGIAIAFTGRILMTEGLSGRDDMIGLVARIMSLPILSIGFGMVILNALQMRGNFPAFMESKSMTTIGKYSYSLYIWHWIIAVELTAFLTPILPLSDFWKVNMIFIASTGVLIPLSWLSYHAFEALYFKRKQPALGALNPKAIKI